MCGVDWMYVLSGLQNVKCCLSTVIWYLNITFFCTNTDHETNKEGGDDDATDSEVTAKHVKKKRPPKRTVEQNLSNINSAESERKCEVCNHLYMYSDDI